MRVVFPATFTLLYNLAHIIGNYIINVLVFTTHNRIILIYTGCSLTLVTNFDILYKNPEIPFFQE